MTWSQSEETESCVCLAGKPEATWTLSISSAGSGCVLAGVEKRLKS